MIQAFDLVGNPSSVHQAGRSVKKAIEDARVKVAALIGARPRDIVFTSGGTEANNLALFGSPASSYLISPLEHDAVLSSANELANQGKPVSYLKLDDAGQIDLDDLHQQLSHLPQPCLVSVMLVNNEMGLVQNLADVIKVAREYSAFIHSDCVQAAGKVMIDMQRLDLDYLSLSGHKIYGPKGIGALALKPTAPLKAQIWGGGQELGRRSGTENVACIAGFGQAALDALANIALLKQISHLRNKIESSIQQYSANSVIIGQNLNRSDNVTCIAMPNVSGETQVMHMDLSGICVSSGSACSSGKVKSSHVIKALGYDDWVSENSIRVSLGLETTQADIEQFLLAWKQLYDRKNPN